MGINHSNTICKNGSNTCYVCLCRWIGSEGVNTAIRKCAACFVPEGLRAEEGAGKSSIQLRCEKCEHARGQITFIQVGNETSNFDVKFTSIAEGVM